MTFARLHSSDGHEALLRALEAPAVARVAAGKLRVGDVLGMSDVETGAAFQLIRWPDSSGMPSCPRCAADNPYNITSRAKFKCRGCGHMYSVTSGTLLASRKMPLRNYLFALAAVLTPGQFRSILHLSEELGVQYKTAYDLCAKFKAVAEGAGCTVPFTFLTRAAWLLRRSHFRARLAAQFAPRTALYYPYIAESPSAHDEGRDLVLFCNALVPRGLPDYVRADICQDMVLAILEGEETRETISTDARKFIAKVVAESPWKYKWISFDAPISGDDRRTFHDLIAAPQAEAA